MEIIGNSKNVARLQKHFKKMFAGVSSVILNEENSQVLGVMSREGEEVIRYSPVLANIYVIPSSPVFNGVCDLPCPLVCTCVLTCTFVQMSTSFKAEGNCLLIEVMLLWC